VPCPRGNECAANEQCFSGSPCAAGNNPDNGPIVETNVGNYCGTEWNLLMTACESATKCPTGMECAEGEFCYRDFVCDPPPTTTTTTSTTVAVAISDMGGGTGSNQATSLESYESYKSDESSTSDINQKIKPSEACSLCGNAELDWSQQIYFDGADISCGEFGWLFLYHNIVEGSDQCLNFRAQFFGKCCYTRPAGAGCDLCDTGPGSPWHDTRQDKNVEFDGDEISCVDLQNKGRQRFEPSGQQCADLKNNFMSSCCFEKCSLCGDTNLNWEASVYFSGEEVLCHELDSKIFVEEGISADSQRCEMSRSFYAGNCCIVPPEEPCNLCSSNGVHFGMNSAVEVSYEGEVKTCLEVYHSLFSRREQSSDHCTDTQGQLFDQCCEEVVTKTLPPASASADYSFENNVDENLGGQYSAPVPIQTKSPTKKPTPDFESWYTDSFSSPAQKPTNSIGSFFMLIAAGLMILY